MSLRFDERMRAIWALDCSATETLLLIALNSHGDGEGQNIFPSVQTLAWETKTSKTTVCRLTQGLCKKGFIKKSFRMKDGHRTSNDYQIDFSAILAASRKPLKLASQTEPSNETTTQNGKYQNGTKRQIGTKVGPSTIKDESPASGEIEHKSQSGTYQNATCQIGNLTIPGKDKEIKREEFPNSDRFELDGNGQDPEEDPTPLPPAPKFEHPAITMERRLRGNAPAKRSGYTSLNPWNIDNDPNKVDPEFKAHLVNTSDYITFGEKPSEIRVEQWVGQANKDEARRSLVLDAWKKFDAERREKAARTEARRQAEESHKPENNAAYRRFEAAIASHPKSLRVEVAGYNWQGLKVNMWYKGIPIMTMQPFDSFLLTEVAIGINRNGGKMSLGKLKQILQLEDWDAMFPRPTWRAAA